MSVPSSSAAGARSPAVLTVDVNGGSLIGQLVSAAVRRLRHQGLNVRVRWQPSSLRPPGQVVSVRPGGTLPVGSLVTVIGALQRPGLPGRSAGTGGPRETGHGKGEGHDSGKGNGKGKGNSKGKGKGRGDGNGKGNASD